MKTRLLALAMASAALLAGCGGGGESKPTFSRIVSFGDSLSDVGSYRVGTVAALGGGKYTINGTANKIWVEQLADQVRVAAPCAAQTGLEGSAAQGFSAPATRIAGCFGYGQGGARVTNPIGPGNKALGGANAVLGQMTVPVVSQMTYHANNIGFSGAELVTVLAGGNDIFMNFGSVGAGSITPTQAVTAMGTAGGELAGYIRSLVLGKGAQYVVVVGLPDVSKTPFGLQYDAATQGLISQMSKTFNDQLVAGLSGANVIFVDAYTISRDQAANPARYSINNNTVPACDLTPAKNPLGSSLVCSSGNLIPGNLTGYQFADAVHPTPFGYSLITNPVVEAMRAKGWL